MQVVLQTSRVGACETLSDGDLIDLPEPEANRMIVSGQARGLPMWRFIETGAMSHAVRINAIPSAPIQRPRRTERRGGK